MKFSITTFGCQMNKHDSDRLAVLLERHGHRRAEEPDAADLRVFNTCCVRQSAENRLLGNVAALRAAKERNPRMLIVVTGCMGQKDAQGLLRQLPHVDIITGTANWSAIPALVETVVLQGGPLVHIEEDMSQVLPAALDHVPAVDTNDPARAWLAISSGCDNHCSYCIVPRVRGPERSKPFAEVISEVEELVDKGVREVTLLGQNVNSYGRDLCGEARFAELLESVASTAGLKRLRFTTSHPKDFTEEIAAVMAGSPVICPHVHLPVQAGADRVLEAMGRGYTAREYLRRAEMIRRTVPGVAITTDIMVGFPGETEDDFAQTLQLATEVAFEQAFMFIYSPRPGTPAAQSSAQIDAAVKKERFSRLLDVQHASGMQRNLAEVGKLYSVYIEGLSRKGEHNLAGRTAHSKLVHLKGPAAMVGEYVTVEITEPHSWFLIGELKGNS